MSCKDEVVRCLKQCSVKGVPRLFKVKSVHLRGLWAVAIVVFLGTGFYQSYELIEEYLSYPKLTIVKETEFSARDDFVFPTLQICNVNQLGLLRDAPQNETLTYFDELVDNFTDCPNCTVEEDGLLRRMREELHSPYGYITYLGVDKALKLMNNYTDFMIECLVFKVGGFVGTECDTVADIRVILVFGYLSCLRIKFPSDIMIDKVSMTFYIDSFENEMTHYNSGNKWVTQSSGIKYSILYSDAKNVDSVNQPTAPPGALTSVHLQKEVHRRLSEPHGNCDPSEFNYTYENCRITCIRSSFPKYCNCISPADYEPKEDKNLKFCISATLPRPLVLQYYACAGKAYQNIVAECSETCKEHCQEIRYKTDVSFTKWPLPHQFGSFYNKFIKDKPFSKRFDILDNNDNYNHGDGNTTENSSMEQLNSLLKRQLVEDNFLKIDFILSNKAFR